MRKNMYGCHDALCQFGNDFTPGMITRWGEEKEREGEDKRNENLLEKHKYVDVSLFHAVYWKKKDLPIINFAQSEPTKSFIGKAHC